MFGGIDSRNLDLLQNGFDFDGFSVDFFLFDFQILSQNIDLFFGLLQF